MTTKGAFYYHYYEQFYTLSYIDKMWGIMRNEAFPKYIKMWIMLYLITIQHIT